MKYFEKQILAKFRIFQEQTPSYSPNPAPSNFFLFPKMEIHHKGKICGYVIIEIHITTLFYTISTEEFKRCFD